MTKDEALKLALEALEMVVVDVKTTPTAYETHRQAITAIKQALAAPVQEPVGYVAENGVVDWNVCAPPILTDLYTTPPAAQRQWQSLTDDEVIKCTPTWGGTVEDVARAIEAKLKEKNT